MGSGGRRAKGEGVGRLAGWWKGEGVAAAVGAQRVDGWRATGGGGEKRGAGRVE